MESFLPKKNLLNFLYSALEYILYVRRRMERVGYRSLFFVCTSKQNQKSVKRRGISGDDALRKNQLEKPGGSETICG